MTKGEAVNWIINLSAAIGKIQHQDLWHYEQALAEIKEMLEAEPVQKTGKWYEDEEVGLCRCDQCQAVNLIHTPFCPMCGAKMEVEE